VRVLELCGSRRQGVRLQVGLDAGGQRQLLDAVHGCPGDDGPTAELLEAQHCAQKRYIVKRKCDFSLEEDGVYTGS
jgi:hypothetical protein